MRAPVRVLALVLLAGAPGGAAWAQEPTAQESAAAESAEATPSPEPAPGPIRAADVPAAAARTLAEVRRLEAVLEPHASVQQVATALEGRADDIRSMRSALDRLDADRLSTRYLHDLRVGWQELHRDLERWRERLDDRWKTIQETRDILERERERWEATRRLSAEEQFPAELIESIDGVLADLDGGLDLVRRRSDAVARVIDRLSEESGATDSALARLEDLSGRLRSRMFQRDEVPIWRIATARQAGSLGEEAKEARRYWLTALGGWARDNPAGPLLFVGLLALFVAGGLALRRRSRGWLEDDPARRAARHVVSRPFSAGLAFTVVTWMLFSGDVVSPVTDVIGLLVAVPMLRLGLGLVAPALRPAIVGIVAASVLARFWALSPDGSLLRRLLLLAGTAAVLVGARLVLRRWRRESSGGWGLTVALGLELVSVLLGVSVAANLLGWVNLAHHLGDGAIQSAFAAAGWLVVVRAASGLLSLLRGAPARRFATLERQGERLERLLRGAIGLAAFALWAMGTLDRFDVTAAVYGQVSDALGASLRLGGLEISLGAVLAAVAIMVSTVPLSRALRVGLEEEVLPQLRLPAGADNSVLTLVNYAVVAVGLVLAAGAAGLGSTQLAVVFGALGVGIGFGLQNVVNNFVSGLILIFERPIKVGDRVETASHVGIVRRIGIRSSTVRTFDGAEVVVPNGELISKEVVNWTLSDQVRRVEVLVGVAYGSDPHRVVEVLRGVADADERVLDDPAPIVLMVGFGDSSLDFRVLLWVAVEDFLEVGSRMHLGLHDALRKAGIEIPFPQRDLHLRSADPEAVAGLKRADAGPEDGAG